MQSFKQFLKEENASLCPKLVIPFTVDTTRLPESFKIEDGKDKSFSKNEDAFAKFLIGELQKDASLGKVVSLVIVDSTSVTKADIVVYLDLKEEDSGTKQNLKTLGNHFKNVITKNIFPELAIWSFQTSEIYVYKTLDQKIEYMRVRVAGKSDFSLKGIHKFLECNTLIFNSMYNIKSGGLGLLKIKQLQFMPSMATRPKWYEIFCSHLKDKDILACQEELIEAGFKEYAKL